MSKRAAVVQLTQDNVDELDDVSEEPGKFEVASDEQLKQRVIKKARRNRPLGDNPSGTSIFAGLRTQPLSLELERKPLIAASTTEPAPVAKINPLGAAAPVAKINPLGAVAPVPAVKNPYLVQLKALNESVSEWIRKHVDTDPYVDLTPIFKDYQTHLATVESKYKNVSDKEGSQESEQRASETETTAEEVETTEEEPFTSTAESQESTTQEESQGEAPSKLAEDDDDSLLVVRAKLFYKKEAEYCALGTGNLKVQSSREKAVRLLLRNDTAVGKILLNVRVTSDIPVSTKSNNVFVVCVANPPLTKNPDNSPVTYLIRVKTAQMAEKLLSTLKDNTN